MKAMDKTKRDEEQMRKSEINVRQLNNKTKRQVI